MSSAGYAASAGIGQTSVGLVPTPTQPEYYTYFVDLDLIISAEEDAFFDFHTARGIPLLQKKYVLLLRYGYYNITKLKQNKPNKFYYNLHKLGSFNTIKETNDYLIKYKKEKILSFDSKSKLDTFLAIEKIKDKTNALSS